MASGGEVTGHCPSSSGSEDLDQLKCQPCLEDGNLRPAAGMCVDCQDYLCSRCYEGHTLPKPSRKHQLLDREQMLLSQMKPTPRDVCTEPCPTHQEEVLQYFCLDHLKLGCPLCVTMVHNGCTRLKYIPHVAKDLCSNTEYRQIELELISALDTFRKVSENAEQNTEELETSCTAALESVKAYRKKVEKAFDKIEAKLIEKTRTLKTRELDELEALKDKYKKAEDDLLISMKKIEALQSCNQNCGSYIEMMKTKDKLTSLDAEIKEAKKDQAYRRRQIQFTPNDSILSTLSDPEALGIISSRDQGKRQNKVDIVGASFQTDVNVRSGDDTRQCYISGILLLPNNKLVVVDYNNNNIKSVNADSGQVITVLKLSSRPWDICAVDTDRLAVTVPNEKKIEIVALGDSSMSIDRTISVNGKCYGIDYRNGKLAVSFYDQHKVEILDLQGTVLSTISVDKQGSSLFSCPLYLAYGLDDTTVYVSNYSSHNITCVKVDGTVVSTYTDSELQYPRKPVIDSSGNVYVCTHYSGMLHQISLDCRKLRTLLTKDDGLTQPWCIYLSEDKDRMYVGMPADKVKVYKIERRAP